MAAKYVLKKTTNNEYMFNLRAGNAEVILTSERYDTKAGAENGIQSVRDNSPHDHRYDRRTATTGQPYFALKAPNGRVIGTSELYNSITARERGIESVKHNGPGAPTEDQTRASTRAW